MTAIGLVAAMTVVSGAVGWLFYARIEGLLITVIRDQTPKIVSALKLAEASSRLATGALAYASVRNHIQRQNVAVALDQQAHYLEDILERLRTTGIDQTRLDQIQKRVSSLTQNLEQENFLVDQRLTLEGQLRRARTAVAGSHESFGQAVHAVAAAARSDPGTIGRLWDTANVASRMVDAYYDGERLDRADLLDARRASYSSARDGLVAALATLPDDGTEVAELRRAAQALIERVEAPDGGFVTLAAMIRCRDQLRALDNETSNTVSQLSIAVVRLVDELESKVDDTSRYAGQQIASGRISLLAIAVATFLGPLVFVWLLVGRTIVLPLTCLARATRRIAAGELNTPIPASRRDEIGELAGALAVFRDLAVALRASETRLRSILEAAVYPILIMRADDGRVLFANDQAIALFKAGQPRGLTGEKLAVLFETPDQAQTLDERLRQGDRVHNLETRLRALDGTTFWALLSAVGMTYLDQPAVLASVNDISERKEIEEAQRRAQEESEHALAELKLAKDQLVQSEKLAALGGLVAGMAHEINTPVGIVLTSASLAADEIRSMRARVEAGNLRRSEFLGFLDTLKASMEIALNNIRRATDLVESFKTVAVDQISETPRCFDLKTYLSEVIISLSPIWRKAGHRVRLDCPDDIEIEGVPGVLSQILSNFITNSVIHGFNPGETGEISISVTRVTPDLIELVHADTGKGIPLADQGRVFEPFFTTNRNAGSTGLGLHIVYNLVTNRLGGRIRLETPEAGGVRFTVRFPTRTRLTAPSPTL